VYRQDCERFCKLEIAPEMGKRINVGVLVATQCVLTALQKAIREHVVLIITRLLHGSQPLGRKAVKCRP